MEADKCSLRLGALVLGGLGGVGQAICQELHAQGFFVIATSRRPPSSRVDIASSDNADLVIQVTNDDDAASLLSTLTSALSDMGVHLVTGGGDADSVLSQMGHRGVSNSDRGSDKCPAVGSSDSGKEREREREAWTGVECLPPMPLSSPSCRMCLMLHSAYVCTGSVDMGAVQDVGYQTLSACITGHLHPALLAIQTIRTLCPHGSVICMGSDPYTEEAAPDTVCYCVAKAALQRLVECTQEDMPFLHCECVQLPDMDTGLWQRAGLPVPPDSDAPSVHAVSMVASVAHRLGEYLREEAQHTVDRSGAVLLV
ncbi:hypothetical protein KIPB_011367 [Kipferlia bialata]|uniref:Uncharacterized protein n=1 Tax=Kipferlia bialata TaxID=797122 RepID=A0A9K3D4M6_9EUKA|nr:hypothetical protein KIPB_011367 [Kipferlia bialata]|eukprot:g11367.t1